MQLWPRVTRRFSGIVDFANWHFLAIGWLIHRRVLQIWRHVGRYIDSYAFVLEDSRRPWRMAHEEWFEACQIDWWRIDLTMMMLWMKKWVAVKRINVLETRNYSREEWKNGYLENVWKRPVWYVINWSESLVYEANTFKYVAYINLTAAS